MEKILMTSTSDLRLSAHAAETHSAYTAPDASFQGTGLSCAGSAVVWRGAAPVRGVVPSLVLTAQVAPFAGVRFTDLSGLPPRGAPV